MSLILDEPAPGTPNLSRARGVRLIRAAPALWRIVDGRGLVLGHLRAIGQGAQLRYSARRFHAPSRAFLELGEFWSADDAVECVTFSR
ncbi:MULTISPECIES: hypothetical protein [unclassified Microbacterium]|uniref:hypothetical protein n=1 Tax=unclassified Microbacterium TaxID=2609290 RepID=UPI00214C8C72|nr:MULTISPECIES: hypothetical protein [unclassified Microbacterium]MCR2809447.1 hypothetical protein [Microbacterium sp. zg.B185]WIM20582.1 hypothetical protein QNO12_07260 [Microbacterium sp. zg-B185]